MICRSMNFIEFYWKYYVHRGRIVEANQTWALMVTPAIPASSAQIFDDRHEAYACMCVVAFWRHSSASSVWTTRGAFGSTDSETAGRSKHMPSLWTHPATATVPNAGNMLNAKKITNIQITSKQQSLCLLM